MTGAFSKLVVGATALLLCVGCDSGPELPGPLPMSGPIPGPPAKPRAAWSELTLLDLEGKPISTIRADAPFRAILRLRLEEGYPAPKRVRIHVGFQHPKAFVTGSGATMFLKVDASGEMHGECEVPKLSRPRKDWLVRASFPGDKHFVELPLEVVEAPKP